MIAQMIESGIRIVDCYPLKAQYASGEIVELAIEIANGSDFARTVGVRCAIRELDRVTESREHAAVVAPGGTETIRLRFGPYETAFSGYGADVELLRGEETVDRLSTAFDVVDDWRRATRYGFLSDFGAAEAGDEEDVKWMAKLHLNLVQFYDWMYRHDELVGEEAEYTDLMGRVVNRGVVEEKIRACHALGMKAIAYGAVYAASRAFADARPDWRLYTSAGTPYDFIGIFAIMNTAPDSPWHAHIIDQYRQAVERMDFDGIHLDTYGFPKTGWSRLNGERRLERLEEHFPVLIDGTRKVLSEAKEDACLIFNNVGNWPVDTVARAEQDAIYVEVWKPYERYSQLRDIIGWAKHLSDGKNIILAAYLKPFRIPGPHGADGAMNAFRLLNAVVAAHGAYHLLHGENGGVLTQGYYVDHSLLAPDQLRVVRDYCDFGVRYGHVTHDRGLRDVSMTHADGDNLEYEFTRFDYSTYGEAGKVWTVIMEGGGRKLVHFINFSGLADDYWNEDKAAPTTVAGRTVYVAIDREVEFVLLASPDRDGGRPTRLDCRVERHERGLRAVVELPELAYWDLLIIE
ncbi:glycoside hydrolase family 66 protein [Cohnella sp. GCM10027633]|uniref:glycoside hydrolase family 66 protein n=1 Tax=unclassified Cohnella TaxID=2636738 RepID=UPI00362FAADC